jgi:putative transposase
MRLITALWLALRAGLTSRVALIAENLALRHQLSILQRSAKRPQLRPLDRLFWVWLSRWWPNWRSALKIFQPDTVTKWHRQGFKLYWRWMSKPQRSISSGL